MLRDELASLTASRYADDRDKLVVLHHKVCNVVDDLKATGMAPEHVMLAVKKIAVEAIPGPVPLVLVDDIVRWCLEWYFKR